MTLVRDGRGVLLPAVVTVAGLIALGVAQGLPNRHSIEDKLTDRSRRALVDAGLSDVEVRFVGRDGTIRVRTAADGERAAAIVRAQDGVRVARVQLVADQPNPVLATSSPTVTIAVDHGRAVLTGAVPSPAARTALVDSLRAAFGAGGVEDRLTVDPSVNDAGLAGLGGVAAAFGNDATAAIDLRGGVVTLTGTVATTRDHDNAVWAAQAVSTVTPVVDRLVVAAPLAPSRIQARLGDLPTITFESGSTTLTAQGRAVVADAAAILAANSSVRVRIEGHTDTNGSAAANLALSQARAQAVLSALAARGIAPSRMVAVGFGETRLKVPDTTPANQAINRRVTFVVLPS